MPNINAQSLAVRKLWAVFKSRSKVTVKSHVCQNLCYHWKGHVLRNTFAKYESLISYDKKLRQMIKFVRSRSKVTVKVTCSKLMYRRKGLVIRNADAKYESPTC